MKVGYRDVGSGECEDEDECVLEPGLCLHGDCVNNAGSYTCSCHKVQGGPYITANLNIKHVLKQMQYRYAAICETLSSCVQYMEYTHIQYGEQGELSRHFGVQASLAVQSNNYLFCITLLHLLSRIFTLKCIYLKFKCITV